MTSPSSAPYLLINNNNSRTKFALADHQHLLEHRVTDTSALTSASLLDTLAGWQFQRIVLASVVPEKAQLIRDTLAQHYPLVEVSHQIELGIKVDFPNPSSIGADRLANAAAVIAIHHSAPAIVVDFGTAVTFDIISADNAYIGGVIAPGLDVMTDYMHQRTALLPKIDLAEPPAAIGKSTVDAMLSGAVHGYRGLVQEILVQTTHELPSGKKPMIVATGGYAKLIAAGLPQIESVEPYLTLEGLRIIGNLNFKHT
ncbi:MAG: type III pantothenate kinase [Verrucomicrobiales bacterium]|nr:type III pantothenate kinase [Verrucomicrobiales bacterium]